MTALPTTTATTTRPATAEARGSPGEWTDTVALPAPLDIARAVAFLRRTGDDLMDRWDGTRLTRLLVVDGHRVPLAMRPAGEVSAPRLVVTAPADAVDTVGPAAVRTAVTTQFAPCPDYWAELLRRDARLARQEAETPGVRLLGLTSPLYSLVRSITAQQVNLTFANRIRARLARSFGTRYAVAGTEIYGLDTDRLAGASISELRGMQLSERKATYLVGVAEELAAGRLDVAELSTLDDEEFLRAMTRVRGIGRWTAEWFGARILFRPMLVAGDVALRKAVGRLYEAGMPSEARVRELAAHWAGATHVAQQVVLETCR